MEFRNLLSGKKGYIISEALIIPLSLVIIGMMIFMASSTSVSDQKKFEELAPELDYELPKTVVYSFVNYPLSDNDSKNIFGDTNNRVVSDLMWIDADSNKDLIYKYKNEFIDSFDFDEILKLYKTFSNDEMMKSNLLKIKFEPGFSKNLESELDDGNFFLRVPKSDGGDVLVYFKGGQ